MSDIIHILSRKLLKFFTWMRTSTTIRLSISHVNYGYYHCLIGKRCAGPIAASHSSIECPPGAIAFGGGAESGSHFRAC
jgi:hypothetical protein